MINIKPYENYKPSGITWLGGIPEHWKVPRLRFLCKITTGSKNTEDKKVDGLYNFYVRSQKVAKIDSYSFEGEGILTAGDGVGVGKVFHYVNEKFDFHQRVYLFFNFRQNIWPKFLFYYLRRNLVIDLKLYNAKSTVDSVRLPTLQNFPINLPSLAEQISIANFLDYKTTKIDRFIRKKKQLIKLLNEQKAGIINDAVTKGLNPKAKMKPSGIEWLGDIPEHWEMRRIGIFGRFSKGGGISRADLLSEGKAAILYGDIYTKYNYEVRNIINRISAETANNSIKLEIGDLLLTGSGETKEDIGKCIAFLSEEETYAGGDVIIFKQTYNDSLFLSYALSSKGAVYQKIISSKGDIIVHIYGSKLKNIRIPIPPMEEQTAIVSHIEKETATIDKTIATIEKEITLVQEYRTALIAEAVTGKIDVRDYVFSKIEEDELYEEMEDELNIAAEDEAEYENQEIES